MFDDNNHPRKARDLSRSNYPIYRYRRNRHRRCHNHRRNRRHPTTSHLRPSCGWRRKRFDRCGRCRSVSLPGGFFPFFPRASRDINTGRFQSVPVSAHPYQNPRRGFGINRDTAELAFIAGIQKLLAQIRLLVSGRIIRIRNQCQDIATQTIRSQILDDYELLGNIHPENFGFPVSESASDRLKPTLGCNRDVDAGQLPILRGERFLPNSE